MRCPDFGCEQHNIVPILVSRRHSVNQLVTLCIISIVYRDLDQLTIVHVHLTPMTTVQPLQVSLCQVPTIARNTFSASLLLLCHSPLSLPLLDLAIMKLRL